VYRVARKRGSRRQRARQVRASEHIADNDGKYDVDIILHFKIAETHVFCHQGKAHCDLDC